MDSRDLSDDEGGAIVEFVLVLMVFVVPLVYLVAVISYVQAATYAVELAAREAARAAVVEGVRAVESGENASVAMESVTRRVEAGTSLVVEDFGFDAAQVGTLELRCSGGTCFDPGSAVHAQVGLDVWLPWLPAPIGAWAPTVIHVEAASVAAVDDYGGSR